MFLCDKLWQHICKVVHVLPMFLDEPVVCRKHNKLSLMSQQHIRGLDMEKAER